MTFSTFASPGVGLQGGGGSGGTASLPISGDGATITTSTPLIDGTQTWNSGATTFTSLLLNVTDTASAAGSLLMDLQVGGSSAFNVSKGGSLKLGRNASGTNVAASNVVIAGSQGTGTGAGGSIVFQVAPAGSSGTAQNALATALTIDSTRLATFAGNLTVPLGSYIGTPNLLVGTGPAAGFYLGAGDLRLYVDPGTAKMAINVSETAIKAASNYAFSWSNADAGGTPDVLLRRDDANKLALRNGANAQFLRVYSTYTDASNYERGAINTGADFVELAAETAGTGDDNLDVRLTPAGTGNVRFGTHTGTADTAVSGYIEIKDAGGTIRKLAVIT